MRKWIFALLSLMMATGLSAGNPEGETKDSLSLVKADSSTWAADYEFTRIQDSLYTQIQRMWQLEQLPFNDEVAADPEPMPNDSVLKSRMTALDEMTPFDLSYNRRVRAFINLYANKKPDLTAKTLGLSQLYFPFIEEALDRHDMPYELKYLAVVESALNPTARSRAGATGLWQFMYSTGKIYGLRVNSYVDERYDPYLSTEAACKYLKFLHGMYDDWNLALAAYNCGPGNVNKAIRRSGGKRNYWEIYPYLPRETRGYVPAFIAVNYIFNHAEEHGISAAIPPTTHFENDTVRITERISLKHLSDVLEVDSEVIQYLNPTFKRGIIPNNTRDYVLKLPKDKLALFIVNEKSIYEQYEVPQDRSDEMLAEHEKVQVYRVRSGDYLGKIANQHGCSVRQIKDWNGLRSDNLRVGQRLTIYARVPAKPTPKPTKQKIEQRSQVQGNLVYYEIQKGDTLWDIAKAQGISTSELKAMNQNLNARSLKPGDKIVIRKNG
ncbi:LysM peptidoglycan-binding domain-containing protein [bacterium SCSIO 12741]|nr:LysM peptidoglycan-binding domain-containing protein [bacterium SCSIO 12741]